jgi:hypothetical protein
VAAAAVTTGMEFSIALADLGNPAAGSVIKIAAMINNGDHNYLSNQTLGGLPAPQGNLASNGNGQWFGDVGDYNLNREVDAADYVTWRNNATPVQAEYERWIANFGMPVPAVNFNNFAGDQFFSITVPGLAGAATVPEPGAVLLAMIGGVLSACFLWRRR